MSRGEKIDSSIAIAFALVVFLPVVHWFSAGVKWADFALAAVALFWAWQVYNDWKHG